jgi:hypothetical protein
LLELLWHLTMANLSFIFEQLFILLVPELVVWFEGGGVFISPSEPDFVQEFLSVWLHFVVLMEEGPLPMNSPTKKKLVLLVLVWHHTVAIDSFELD